jgi:hypothetical protein
VDVEIVDAKHSWLDGGAWHRVRARSRSRRTTRRCALEAYIYAQRKGTPLDYCRR